MHINRSLSFLTHTHTQTHTLTQMCIAIYFCRSLSLFFSTQKSPPSDEKRRAVVRSRRAFLRRCGEGQLSQHSQACAVRVGDLRGRHTPCAACLDAFGKLYACCVCVLCCVCVCVCVVCVCVMLIYPLFPSPLTCKHSSQTLQARRAGSTTQAC